jgi:hypothetical protein
VRIGVWVCWAAVVIAACTSRLPMPEPSSAESPTAFPSSSARLDGPAQLQVTGTGACGGFVVLNFGYCEPLFLLSATPGSDFSDWVMSDNDPVFVTERLSSSAIGLTGPLLDGPTSLAPGAWSVGIGVRNTSDVASEAPSFEVLCYRSITVPEGIETVDIWAHLDQQCSIDVSYDDLPVPMSCGDETLYLLADSSRDRVETRTYPGTTVITITVTSLDDPDFVQTAVVDSADPGCVHHTLIGPILRGISDGYEPESAKPADLVGRLMVIDTNAACTVILDRDGLTWDPIWPAGYSITERGVLGTHGQLVAENGALVGLTGRQATRDLRWCLIETGFEVNDLSFVEPQSP